MFVTLSGNGTRGRPMRRTVRALLQPDDGLFGLVEALFAASDQLRPFRTERQRLFRSHVALLRGADDHVQAGQHFPQSVFDRRRTR